MDYVPVTVPVMKRGFTAHRKRSKSEKFEKL
jgi:hypothetical protein